MIKSKASESSFFYFASIKFREENKMEIKVLETKLQTILEDDTLEITKENIIEKIEDILGNFIGKFARLNDATTTIEYLKDEYISDFRDIETSNLFDVASDAMICLFDNECLEEKDKVLEIINEIFYNQDLYDLIKNYIPSIKKLVDKLNSDDCIFEVEDIIYWIKDDLASINTENIKDITVYEYLDKELEDFNNLFVPEEKIKIVVNK